MSLCGGESLGEAVGVQTAVQTNSCRHLGRGIETAVAAPAFQWVNRAQWRFATARAGLCCLARSSSEILLAFR